MALGSRPGRRQDSCFPGILSATLRVPQELGLPEGLAGFLRQICCGKSLELGLGKDHICLQTSARGEMCVWGAGGYASPALDYVGCLYDPGQEDDWAECPAGLGVGTTVALLPLLPASPCRAGMWGWLSSPPEACLQRPSVRCPLQQAASLESLMGTSLLSTEPGSGGLG